MSDVMVEKTTEKKVLRRNPRVKDTVQSTSVTKRVSGSRGEETVLDRYHIEINNILVDIKIISYEKESVPENLGSGV